MMKFVLIVVIFISLQYKSSQYGMMLSPLFRPYYNTDRYSQTMYGYPQTTAFYSVYRNDIPENRSNLIPKKTRNVEQTPSQQNEMQEMQLRLDLLRNHFKKIQEPSATNNSPKTETNPNVAIYKGKPTRKTSASFRSASV
ncbi:uncharacterized protein LOC132922867 [Rhopalosiphum padi]|uniref:uncharacterized protein LOC132922867 n=1 Tax=Rhopalosiphum padi TaxID=40932 RepID=UPI00298EB956|nr:uncharacterized protein LOC132922867 [Rhopalosiphum padi]